MSPKTKKHPKQNEKKRKNPPAPPEPESDDSTSGTEAETRDAGDVEEENIRLSKSAVYEEYDQISETLQVKTKTGKRIKVKKWKSSCKHKVLSEQRTTSSMMFWTESEHLSRSTL